MPSHRPGPGLRTDGQADRGAVTSRVAVPSRGFLQLRHGPARLSGLVSWRAGERGDGTATALAGTRCPRRFPGPAGRRRRAGTGGCGRTPLPAATADTAPAARPRPRPRAPGAAADDEQQDQHEHGPREEGRAHVRPLTVELRRTTPVGAAAPQRVPQRGLEVVHHPGPGREDETTRRQRGGQGQAEIPFLTAETKPLIEPARVYQGLPAKRHVGPDERVHVPRA